MSVSCVPSLVATVSSLFSGVSSSLFILYKKPAVANTRASRLPIIRAGGIFCFLRPPRCSGRELPRSSSASRLPVLERALFLGPVDLRVLPPAEPDLLLEALRLLALLGRVLLAAGRAVWASSVPAPSCSAWRRARSFSFILGPSRFLRGVSSGASSTFLGGVCLGLFVGLGLFAGTGLGLGAELEPWEPPVWDSAGGTGSAWLCTGPTATIPPHFLHLALSAAKVGESLYSALQSPQMPLR